MYSHFLSMLRRLPPEAAHKLTVGALGMGLGPIDRTLDDPVLETQVWGLRFGNPVGLAAGFDKGAQVPDAMMRAGFGFAEAGTVTPLPQSGNPKPRMFRLSADNAAINRLGFNGKGLAPFVKRIARRGPGLGPFGANVGKNKDTEDGAADYEIGIEAVAPYASYLVTNISSPNTPGLRAMQGREQLADMIYRVLGARARAVPEKEKQPPLIVKIAPDLDDGERADIAAVIIESGVDGMTVANTTVLRPSQMLDSQASEVGGLSGVPLFPIALEIIGDMYRRTHGKIPIIGCGGISSGADAYRMIRAGAVLVQLYTALVFFGPQLIPRIKEDLAILLKKDGFSSVSEAVGADIRLSGADQSLSAGS
ncbi:MAG: quinone-dependent dihydroorotate dehydrogenase [Pseudomonadota bacterium]|nr:quinone-dependent dihydroorotate dehydrogenase [Pseudomonadota bacterium]